MQKTGLTHFCHSTHELFVGTPLADKSPVLYHLFQEPQSFDEFWGQFCQFSGKSKGKILLERSTVLLLLCGTSADKNDRKASFKKYCCFVMRLKDFPAWHKARLGRKKKKVEEKNLPAQNQRCDRLTFDAFLK